MSSTNNSIPTLNSLVAQVDALMKSPPAADADFLAITAFFNKVATIKFISRLVIQFHFTDQWLSIFCVETTRLWAAASGNYHLTGDQILGELEVLPPIRYRIDEDILMSSTPFSPVLSATKSILGLPKSASGGSTAIWFSQFYQWVGDEPGGSVRSEFAGNIQQFYRSTHRSAP
ncbi:hypothetical protein IW261DRAFT_1427505 [Armillaria novae-zelandiae]|uniref:Uncharacterized protein n=1 Tax=Armillaria novae-zelandiae TaxID=153914 RepID=A0AA39NE88_9AGAR|nr:hypothetical protein IW261DRAFT_1427505 [Armillaria novae-zelandiae]